MLVNHRVVKYAFLMARPLQNKMASPRFKILHSPLANHFAPDMQGSHGINASAF
jgi:hypothetical protein